MHKQYVCRVPRHAVFGLTAAYKQVVRTKGPRSTLLYNLVGSANWEVLMMEASISAGGGLSRNISLTDIPEPPKPKDAS